MKQTVLVLFGIFLSFTSFSNVDYIDISKISKDSSLIKAYTFVRENQRYYSCWSPKWNFDKPKEEFCEKLKACFSQFSLLSGKSEELSLLLGDIAHYLYNLDDTAYYHIAIENYNSAIRANPADYRPYWFLGVHYALANVPVQAFDNLLKAERLLLPGIEQPVDFWDDYAMVTYMANMPAHCIYAMDRAKSITGQKGNFETQVGDAVSKRIVPVDKDKSYSKQELWAVEKGEKIGFVSRPLGIKILLDSTWHLSLVDYANHKSAFIIHPPAFVDSKGEKINPSVVIFMKVASNGDQLEDYISHFVSKYAVKDKIAFSDKYKGMVAYEIKDHTIYQNHGGGHSFILGIEREKPRYSGLSLENSVLLPRVKGGLNYYRASEVKDRFAGKIFYAIILDSSEDIYKQTFEMFKNLFDQQIIIE